jgi:hypothetical protein
LIDRGHEVIGTFRSPGNAEHVRALGGEPIALDLLDAHAVSEAVAEAEPDAIVNEATALAGVRFSRNLDRSFAQTNRLRTEGTDALLAAAREAGVGRFVAQSFASLRYERTGGPIKTEEDPLVPAPVSCRAHDLRSSVRRDQGPRCSVRATRGRRVRISSNPEETGAFELSLATEARESDEVVEEGGATALLEDGAAELLEGSDAQGAGCPYDPRGQRRPGRRRRLLRPGGRPPS